MNQFRTSRLARASLWLVGVLFLAGVAMSCSGSSANGSENGGSESSGSESSGSEKSDADMKSDSEQSADNDAGHFSHQVWAEVLDKFVDQHGYVDYQALADDRARFDEYLAAIKAHSPKTDGDMFPTKNDELAYYINAYNALVFEGVLDRGPETDSVWTGGLISGKKFFSDRKVVYGGKTTSLKKLEDDVIRGEYNDPRIHAAINCASISCPRLPQEPFVGSQLDTQLDAVMAEFTSNANHVRIEDGGTVHLSKIFDWFKGDFMAYEKAQGNRTPSLIDYINRYREDGDLGADLDIKFMDYDKGVNSQQNKPG